MACNPFPPQKPVLYPIVHPSIGPNVGQKPPHSPSLSLSIANNYRSQQYHQAPPPQQHQQQFEVVNRRPISVFQAPQQLPPKYAPSQPTKLPFGAGPGHQSPSSPLQIFYGGGGGGGRTQSAKLNNQPYVILTGAGASAEKQLYWQQQQHHQHQHHRPTAAHHPGSVQLEQANENQHHNLLTSPEVIKPINPFGMPQLESSSSSRSSCRFQPNFASQPLIKICAAALGERRSSE